MGWVVRKRSRGFDLPEDTQGKYVGSFLSFVKKLLVADVKWLTYSTLADSLCWSQIIVIMNIEVSYKYNSEIEDFIDDENSQNNI